MGRGVRWAWYLLFAGACAPAAPPSGRAAPAATPAPSAAPAPAPPTPFLEGELADPPGSKPGLTPPARVLPEPSAREGYVWSPKTLRFGAGVLQWGEPEENRAGGPERCLTPQADPGPCAAIRVKAASAAAPGEWRWTVSDASPGEYGAFIEDPGWSCLTPSQSWVWATRVGQRGGIDVIDAAGRVKTVLSADALAEARRACVVETATGPLLVSEPEASDARYQQRALKSADDGWSLGPAVKLPFSTPGARSRQGRVNVERGGAWGLAVSHWPSDAGTLSESWLLLHHERAEHRCPIVITCMDTRGSGSGQLSLISAAGKVLKRSSLDGTVLTPLELEHVEPPRLDVGPEGVTVLAPDRVLTTSRTLAPTGSKQGSGAAPSPLAGTPAEQLVAAAFEPALGEGIVLVRRGEQILARRFDANGTALGEATTGDWSNARTPVWAAEGWLVHDGEDLTFVTGKERGRRVPIGTRDGARLIERSGRDGVVMVTKDRVVLVDARKGSSRSCPLPSGEHFALGILSDAAGAPLVAMSNVGEALAWRCRDDGAGERVEHPGTTALTQAMKKLPVVGVARVFRDQVVLTERANTTEHQAVGVWMSTGEASAVDVPTAAYFPRLMPAEGPLVWDRRGLLSSQPGPLAVVGDELHALRKTCPLAFATGARRVLLVCEESARADLPGVSVALRVHRR